MPSRNLNINNEVLESFAEILEVNVLDLNYKKNFSEYSTLDSLGLVKLIINLNNKFNTDLDAEKLLECENIEQISLYIKQEIHE